MLNSNILKSGNAKKFEVYTFRSLYKTLAYVITWRWEKSNQPSSLDFCRIIVSNSSIRFWY